MGFAVLLALIAYVFVARAVARAVEKKTGSKKAKYLTIAIFVLIPTWDIIPGWLYFKHLCDTQAEIKVFKTVEIGKEYFLVNGQPDGQKLGNQYVGTFSFDKEFSPLFHIAKEESVLQDKQTGEMLGATKDFAYRGGWLTRFVLPDATWSPCPAYEQISAHMVLWRKVIKPKPSTTQGEK